MKKLPLEREAIFPRIDGIQKNLKRLEALGTLSLEEFSSGDPFDLAQHHLRLALEGIFHIGAHILSRLPGGRAVEYKEIGLKMAEAKLLPKDFAREVLVPMAGLRNLLVHQYADIDPARLQEIIKTRLQDIEQFLSYVKELVHDPEKFGLTLD